MNDRIMNGIDCIDDSLIEEAMNYRRTRKPIYIAAGAAAAVMLIGTGFLLGTNYMQQYIASYSPPTTDGDTARAEDELTGAIPDEDGLTFGGVWDNGELNDSPIIIKSEPFTEEEAEKCVSANRSFIASSLWSDMESVLDRWDVNSDDVEFKVSTVPFYHIKATDINTLDGGFPIFPVFFGHDNTLVAFFEPYKADGELSMQISYSGPRHVKLNNVLHEYPDSAVAFVYCQGMDIAVTPDNKIYVIGGGDAIDVPDDIDIYSIYAGEYNTFCLSDIFENEQYITVRKEDVYEE